MTTERIAGSVIANASEIDLFKTFECGQCFRWQYDENNVYTGVAYGKVLRIWREDQLILCDTEAENLAFWRSYLDLDADYEGASALFTEPEHLRKCAEYGAGIRILRQEPWETLCSFIISQCNNIPRIKKIIAALCRLYGRQLQEGLYSFPDAQAIASLSEQDLAPLRCGYRAQYILSAARAVSSGSLRFDELAVMPADEAMRIIKGVYGVGDKVANCFMLYGLHRMDSFPIDVWMKRALKQHFPADFDPVALGSWAGLAQQYIFFYARESSAHKSSLSENCG